MWEVELEVSFRGFLVFRDLRISDFLYDWKFLLYFFWEFWYFLNMFIFFSVRDMDRVVRGISFFVVGGNREEKVGKFLE